MSNMISNEKSSKTSLIFQEESINDEEFLSSRNLRVRTSCQPVVPKALATSISNPNLIAKFKKRMKIKLKSKIDI